VLKLDSDTLTIEAFEKRMRLRRRMFAKSGVSLAALHAAQDLESVARHSVETCVSCNADETCGRWLDKTADGGKPPGFCPNHRLIEDLRKEERLRPKAR
jgi:hypothetical protein